MLKISKIFPFLKLLKQTKKYYIFSKSFKQRKERLLLLIPENAVDRVFIVRKTKIPA